MEGEPSRHRGPREKRHQGQEGNSSVTGVASTPITAPRGGAGIGLQSQVRQGLKYIKYPTSEAKWGHSQ